MNESANRQKHDQLECRLERADAIIRLLTNTSEMDLQTLQTVAMDAGDHLREAMRLHQEIATQKEGPANDGQPRVFHPRFRVQPHQPASL